MISSRSTKSSKRVPINPLDVQKKLNEISCPACGDVKFQVTRVEGNPDEEHFEAACRRCGLKMRVVVIPRVVIEGIEAMEPPEERQVLEAKCPHCGGVGARFQFRCHLETGVDYDVVTCRHCRRPYRKEILPGR